MEYLPAINESRRIHIFLLSAVTTNTTVSFTNRRMVLTEGSGATAIVCVQIYTEDQSTFEISTKPGSAQGNYQSQ